MRNSDDRAEAYMFLAAVALLILISWLTPEPIQW